MQEQNVHEIYLGIKRVQFKLTVAYALETGLPGFNSDTKVAKPSKLSRDLDLSRKDFGSISRIKESEIVGEIETVKKSLNRAKKLLKPYC